LQNFSLLKTKKTKQNQTKPRTETMMLPTIHMNGTSSNELLESYCDAISAMHAALEALARVAPNGRDYYPQGPDACALADSEHGDRKHALIKVMNELQVLAEHVSSN
jgi:hypothetical protein